MKQQDVTGRRLWLLGAAWLVLAAVTVAWGLNHEDDDLTDRSVQALQAAGFDNVSVAVDGRDVSLRGADAGEAVEIVAGLSGVRVVDIDTAAAVAAPPATEASDDTAPASTAVAETAETTPTTTPTETTTPPTASQIGADTPYLTASLRNGNLTVLGRVAEGEAAAGLAAITDLIYAPFLDNQLVVDESLAASPWAPGIANAVAVLPIIGTADLEIVGDKLTLSGITGSAEKKAQLEGTLDQIFGGAMQIESAVEVTGKEPPVYEAVAADGAVTLQGVMPDQASIDLIAGAAAQAYGAEQVDNQMIIDDGVEATFSVYRIPLTFLLLQPVPEWEVIIRNDVISGGLRGGATFAFGSSDLTPALEGLCNIAAGILTRNPTVTMTIEGHTDSVGDATFNQQLSVDRAEAGKAFIVGLGVDPARLTAVGFGESEPFADNSTEAGRAQNRRLEFVMGAGS